MIAEDYKEENVGDSLKPTSIFVRSHADQRYPTVGDYVEKDGVVYISVSKMRPHYEFLVAVHEFVESYLVQAKGINIEDIDKFDKEFEEMRSKYPVLIGDSEPGDNDAAPYYHEHAMATRVEKWLASSIGVDWDEYTRTVNSL